MLRIYWTSLDLLDDLVPVIARIARHDRDLARQLRKAATSVPLNIGEGSHQHGGHRRERYQTACSSMREVVACCDSAERLRYTPRVSDDARAKMRAVIGTLVKNLRG